MSTDKIVFAVNEYITKRGKRILCAIYEKKQVLSSELATYLGISRSAMSNSLERLKKSPIPVIIDTKVGRTRQYSLTKEGREYVEATYDVVKAEILIENSKRDNGKDQESDAKRRIVECFKELEEEDEYWSDTLHDCGGAFNIKETKVVSFFNKIEELLGYGVEAKLSGDEVLYTWLLTNIKNKYIRNELVDIIQRREGLACLWDVMVEDCEKAYHMTEILFRQVNFITAGCIISDLEKLGLAKEEVGKLVLAMQGLVTKAKDKGLSKEDFKKLLINEGAEASPFVYYLAEKYEGIE